MQSPTRNFDRPMSPLRSPLLRRRLSDDDIDIHFPPQFLPKRPIYKQSLIGEDGHFRTALDVHDFEISEISVKTVGHTILVTCSHAEKEDTFGHISRSFTKKYVLPLDLEMAAIKTFISKGVLYIKVPPKTPEQPQVRHVDIKIE
jgi:HSP20 family molecular chaperone IbpA